MRNEQISIEYKLENLALAISFVSINKDQMELTDIHNNFPFVTDVHSSVNTF